MPAADRQLTVPKFVGMKSEGKKISMLTAYDFQMASILDSAGVDSILVGDSLGMVVQGNSTTLPVTLDEIIYHAKMVGRGVKRALTIVDIPFPVNHFELPRVIESAGRILKETNCQTVKLEGGRGQFDVVNALVKAGIPVMGHVGLQPQSVHALGGFRVQRNEEVILDDAKALQDAGAFGVVLECVPAAIAKRITEELEIPTIGIGAGPSCDGQVLVVNDLLGMSDGFVPKFVRRYANLNETIGQAAKDYCQDVAEGQFPGNDEVFK